MRCVDLHIALGKAKLFSHKNMAIKDQSAQSQWLGLFTAGK